VAKQKEEAMKLSIVICSLVVSSIFVMGKDKPQIYDRTGAWVYHHQTYYSGEGIYHVGGGGVGPSHTCFMSADSVDCSEDSDYDYLLLYGKRTAGHCYVLTRSYQDCLMQDPVGKVLDKLFKAMHEAELERIRQSGECNRRIPPIANDEAACFKAESDSLARREQPNPSKLSTCVASAEEAAKVRIESLQRCSNITNGPQEEKMEFQYRVVGTTKYRSTIIALPYPGLFTES
jgi:hypothetical protein